MSLEPEILYYVFGEKNPHCSCCAWEHHKSEHETRDGALGKSKDLEDDGYTVWMIHGKDILQYDSTEYLLTTGEKDD